jgi:glycopeptide antibiotics resistance protein
VVLGIEHGATVVGGAAASNRGELGRGWQNPAVAITRAIKADKLALALLVLYLVLLAVLTLRPIGADVESHLRVNLRPWATIGPALRHGPGSFAFSILAGNLLAFVPLGLLLPAANRRIAWPLVILAGMALSTAIEITQYGLSLYVGHGYRAADIDDVIVNVAGTIVGLALFAIVHFGVSLLGRSRPAG